MDYSSIYLEGMSPKIINYLFMLESVFQKKEKNRLVSYIEAMVKFKEMAEILNTIGNYFSLFQNL